MGDMDALFLSFNILTWGLATRVFGLDAVSTSLFHVYTVCPLAVAAICGAIPHTIPHYWTLTYMMLHIRFHLRDVKVSMIVHHLVVMIMYYSSFGTEHMVLGTSSWIVLMEIANPLKYRWKRTKTLADFKLFMSIFFLTRVPYMGWLVWWYNLRMPNDVATMFGNVLFVLSILWFLQQCRVLVRYRSP